MDTVANTLLSNALAAGLLAVLAAAVGRLCRRPALTHALWLLVLVKLVTPPFVHVPLPWIPPPEPAAFTLVAIAAPAEELPAAEPLPLPLEPPADEEPLTADPPRVEPYSEESLTQPIQEVRSADPVPTWAASSAALPWREVLLGIWLIGAVSWFTVALVRVRRFQDLLRWVQPAPAQLKARLDELAARLELSRWPQVWLVPGAVAPLLWALGRPALLIVPADLWERLDEEQRDALLLHELAHWKRHDHWVRWLEFVVLGLYWWHPVAWWARRVLREAEEQCCDAWVVWALPSATRAYASALVETVDFLSTSRPPTPALASGMGHMYDLRRRLIMILRGTTPRTLSWAGAFAVLALAVALLPLAPSWGQPPPAERGRREAEEQKRRPEQDKKDAPRKEAPREGQDRERAQNEIRELTAHIDRMRGELEKAQRRLQELQGQMGGRGRDEFRPPVNPPGGVRPPAGQPGQPPFGGGGGGGGGGAGGRFPGPGGFGGAGGPGGFGGGNMEQRLQEIERKLDALMRSMEGTRRPGLPGTAPPDRPAPGNPPRGTPPRGDGAQPPRPGDAPRPPQPPGGGSERRPTPRPDQPEKPRGELPAPQ